MSRQPLTISEMAKIYEYLQAHAKIHQASRSVFKIIGDTILHAAAAGTHLGNHHHEPQQGEDRTATKKVAEKFYLEVVQARRELDPYQGFMFNNQYTHPVNRKEYVTLMRLIAYSATQAITTPWTNMMAFLVGKRWTLDKINTYGMWMP